MYVSVCMMYGQINDANLSLSTSFVCESSGHIKMPTLGRVQPVSTYDSSSSLSAVMYSEYPGYIQWTVYL
jgi:hypothetical protein